ncbi:uncharacterized protein LOC144167013 [Haemaphysalis longicornis]
MASDPYVEMITILAALMGVVFLITLLWLLVKKFVLGRSALKPAEKGAAPPIPATQQDPAAAASPAQTLVAVSPDGQPAAAGVPSGPTSPEEVGSPGRRSFGAIARRASVAVSRAVKQETAALLQALSAGAFSAQVPTDDDFDNEDRKSNKSAADTAPPKDETTAGTKPPSPSSDQKGGTEPSPSTGVTGEPGRQKDGHEAAENEAPRAQDAAGKTKQGVSVDDNPGELKAATSNPASPLSSPDGRERGAEEQGPKERNKCKDKKRKKSSLLPSPYGSPPSEKHDGKPETSAMRTKRKHKRISDFSPKSPTETADKKASSADTEQLSAAALPSTHAQQQLSALSKGSRTSKKSSSAKPCGAWSEDMSPPASWAPDAGGAKPSASQRDTSPQECSPPALEKPEPPTPLIPNLDIFSREHSGGD